MANLRAGEQTTTHYGWTIPTVGASADAWGGYINTDLQGIDTTIYNLSTNFSGIAPPMDGAAVPGVATTFAHSDHVHPTDTSRAPVVGVANASNAAAGQIGEWITAQQLTAQSMATTVALNLTSISLTAGDWDVDGDVYMISSGSVGQQMGCSLSTTSATMAAVGTPGRAQIAVASGSPNLAVANLATGRLRVNVSTTTTVYLVAVAAFGSGACTAQGTIQARRMR